jgi:uncharacterized protein (DUF58 family)
MEGAGFFKKVKQIELVSKKLVEELLAGNYRSIFRGMGIEFDEVRDYVAGDDIRLIDWNVTSRMGSPFTKTFREERELSLFMVVDTSASVIKGSGNISKSEIVLIVFAILAVSAIKNNDMVGSLFFSDEIERWVAPAKGKKHVLRLIYDLQKIEPGGRGTELKKALRTVSESLKRRGICVIISDFKTDNYWNELTYLSRKHDVIAVRIFDPVDYNFPELGMIELEDPESGRTILSEGRSKKFVKDYNRFWNEQYGSWLAKCSKMGVETLEISTSEDPGIKLVQFFRQRKKRKKRKGSIL